MKFDTPYEKLHARKRTWTPVAIDAGQLLDGGADVIHRALALRCLEIPVGEFISQAMKGDLPDDKGCISLLESNVVDEEKHDIALNYAARAHQVPTALEREAAADEARRLGGLGEEDPCRACDAHYQGREATSDID